MAGGGAYLANQRCTMFNKTGMGMSVSRLLLLVASSATLGVMGCGAENSSDCPVEATKTATNQEELIGGFPANDPSLNAVGSLGVWNDYWSYDPFCTATLIGKQTVLTAKHCTEVFQQAMMYGYHVGFGIGPNGLSPQRVVEVVDIETAPGDQGGFVGYGHDVGVLHLAEKVTDIEPLTFQPVPANSVGKTFTAMGYGIRDNAQNYGIRRVGTVTMQATQGRVFEVMFGSFDAFYQWYWGEPLPTAGQATTAKHSVRMAGTGASGPSGTGGAGGVIGTGGAGSPAGGVSSPNVGGTVATGGSGGGSYDDWKVQEARYYYDSTLLDAGYEVVVGNGEGDAQPCFGDSGSPLLKKTKAGLTIYGVTSGGLGSNRMVCDHGAVYAAFGPVVQPFLTQAKKWVDPCKGLSSTGVCEDDVARRCTSPNEGPRRLVKMDCGAIGLSCSVQSDGTVGCGEGELNGSGGMAGTGGLGGAGGTGASPSGGSAGKQTGGTGGKGSVNQTRPDYQGMVDRASVGVAVRNRGR